MKRGVEACTYIPQSPVSWIGIKTCRNLKERGYLLLCFCDYLSSHVVFEAIRQILRGRYHSLLSNQPKTRDNIFLASVGDLDRDLESFALPSGAITPQRKKKILTSCLSATWTGSRATTAGPSTPTSLEGSTGSISGSPAAWLISPTWKKTSWILGHNLLFRIDEIHKL